ncbi:MAG: YcjF family protein [Synechococcaceae cyanobacterium]|nr:YcjF family protein [Synechococcaceae cyanobacterium]
MTRAEPPASVPIRPSLSASLPAVGAALPALLAGGWPRPALLLAGGLVVSETLGHALHLDGGLFALAGMAGGWWLLSRRGRPVTPRLPASLDGWQDRCRSLLLQFERLEGEAQAALQLQRRSELEALLPGRAERPLDLALVGTRLPESRLQQPLAQGLRQRRGLRLCWGEPLPPAGGDWRWPAGVEACDLLLFHLPLPLLASDLRWLESLPQDQPVWLLVPGLEPDQAESAWEQLRSQWSAAERQRLLCWDGRSESLAASLTPLCRWLSSEGGTLQQATPLRRLQQLHGRWQTELEVLRRREWRALLQRTQWLVAAGVAAAPLASLDLLVLAAANALMLQEMARLWDCPWSADQLRAVALELGQACLGLGVIEWSSQALTTALRLHGATWLLGSGVQALAAAYLTRVVSHAMADYLALSSGVPEPDLEAVKRQAPLLVAEAAAAERLDWPGFLQQAQGWLQSAARPALG